MDISVEDVLFVQSAALSGFDQAFREMNTYPPYGALTMASLLKAQGYNIHLIDLCRERKVKKEDFVKLLKQLPKQPLAVGIAVFTETAGDSLKVAKVVKDVFPETSIIMGAPHPTFCYEDILKSSSHVDIVIRNEAEATIVELLEYLKFPGYPLDEIKGIAYLDDAGKLVVNEKREFITHLDTLPFPAYEMSQSFFDGDTEVFTFMSSRGCPGECVFCASRAMSGKYYRMQSAEWLISQVYYHFKEKDFHAVAVMDDTFLANPKRLKKFCAYMDQLDLKFIWGCKSRVDNIRPEILELLHDHNCISIHIGVESGDDKVLQDIDKAITVEKILNCLKMMREYSIRPECSFILGHPTDTLESMEKTLILAAEIRRNGIGLSLVGISTPFPGTPLARHSEELKLKYVTRDYARYDLATPIYHTDNFSVADLRRGQYWFDNEMRSTSGRPNLSSVDLSEYHNYVRNFLLKIK